MWGVLICFFLCFFKNFFLNILLLGGVIVFLLKTFQFNLNLFKEIFLCDKISLFFVVLSVYIIFFIILLFSEFSYFKNIFGLKKMFLLLVFLTLFFLVDKIFLFYIFFELRVFPAFLMILGWGNNPERFNAIFYLFSYTFIGSFPLIFSLIKNYKILFSLKFYFLLRLQWRKMNSLFSFFIILAFFIKLPLYFLHSWLPKAHVEAPTIGSMILAALLLKMGAYGIFRFSFFNPNDFSFKWNIILGWRIINLGIIGFIIFRLKDLKVIIAFSSIKHMLLVTLGWFLFSNKNLIFCVLLNLGHGFIRSNLFFSIGKFYEKSHSRNVFLKKGINHIKSIFSLIWFTLLIAKSSAPTSISLYREIGMISHFLKYYSFCWVFVFFFVVLGGGYCLILFTKMFHGKFLYFKNFISFENVFNLISFLHIRVIFLFIFVLKNLI